MPLQSSPEQPVPVRTVSRLIGEWVHRLGWVWVEGQVTQLSQRSGNSVVFLTLRDPAADVSITVRCGAELLGGIQPAIEAGSRVLVHARPEFYLNRGTLSLQASELRHIGIGELLARLDRLKQVLSAEGLFAAERKRPLPFLPAEVGLVCGRGSAAEQDVLENAARRWPAVKFTVKNVPVQGPHAVPGVISALRALDAAPEIEVIVIARGGGSVEDLLPFSDEALIRAVAACRTPVVSAIGHEQDSPLLDFVADVRASTPTDAAKRVVPAVAEELALVTALRSRATDAILRWLGQQASWLADVRIRPVLLAPDRAIDLRELELESVRARLRGGLERRVERAEDELHNTRERVRSLSPLATLQRGYAVLLDQQGLAVRTVESVKPGDRLRATISDGSIDVTVDGDRRVAAWRSSQS
jgi:exodeoxyribonuclease VII large subunit